MKNCLIALSIFIFSGCSFFNRSNKSGYSGEGAPAQKSIAAKPQFSKSGLLKKLENKLTGRKEVEQYSKALPWFLDDNEKIEFLSINSFEDKEDWLKDKNFPKRPQQVMSEMRELVDAQDIAIGMPQSLVKKSWGDPESIDVSGNPHFRNERWRYSKFISTPDGFKPEKKTVYFEGGKVVGWDIE